jgi:protein Mpv17
MLHAYLRILQSRPLVTKSLTAGALFASGDIIAQTLLVPPSTLNKPFDWSGLASFSAFGCLLYAPSNHYWFSWMERSIATATYYQTRPMLQALARVTLHSVVYAPFSIICLFLWMGVAQGSSVLALQASVAPQKVFPIWWTGGIFWIPTMLSIYRFVPLHLRVLATSTANVFWTTYLAHKKSVILDASPLELHLEAGGGVISDNDHHNIKTITTKTKT